MPTIVYVLMEANSWKPTTGPVFVIGVFADRGTAIGNALHGTGCLVG